MKKNVIIRTMLFLFFTTTLSFMFMSCQQEELNIADEARKIQFRTSPPEVPANLQIEAGYEVSFHAYAEGVQVYVSTETSPGVYAWILKEPIANLYANANMTGFVGTHYAGPFWESNSGSKVKGFRIDGVTVDPNAIQWLKLGVVFSQGPGIFNGTAFIQRVNTVGGKAPSTGANAGNVGELLSVPYTAEYYFYKPE
jgi:hypothetical protein